MGLNLFYLLFFSVLFSGCLPQSNFKQNSQDLTESDTGSDSVDNDPDPDPVDTSLALTNLSISPKGTSSERANTYYPIVKGTAATNVQKVFIYTQQGCPSNSIAIEKDGPALVDGVSPAVFADPGVELDLSSTNKGASTKIFFRTLKTKTNGGTQLSECTQRFTYVHDIDAPVAFAGLKKTSDGSWLTENPPTPSNIQSPIIKLTVNNSNIARIQVFAQPSNSTTPCSGNVFEHPASVWESDGAPVQTTEGVNKIYARGLDSSGNGNICRNITSYVYDKTPPQMPDVINHSLVSTSRTDSPVIRWTSSTATDLKNYQYSIVRSDGVVIKDWTITSNNSGLEVSGLSLSVGSKYFVKVKGVDLAGNETIVTSKGFKVYNTGEAPSLSITYPEEEDVIGSRSIIVTGKCIGVNPEAKVKLVNTSVGVEATSGNPEVSCSSNDTFSFPITVLDSSADLTGETRSIILRQANGTTSDTVTPERSFVFRPLSRAGNDIAAGGGHVCVSKNNRAYCWGAGTKGQTTASFTDKLTPQTVAIEGDQVDILKVTAGMLHSCGILSNKRAYCWGDNSKGQLGSNVNISTASSSLVKGGLSFIQISAGAYHTCGVTNNNSLYCWGDNSSQQLGIATAVFDKGIADAKAAVTGTANKAAAELAYRSQPKLINLDSVSGITNSKVVQVVTGNAHTCALVTNTAQNVWKTFCWGSNQYGALGYDISSSPYTGTTALPQQVRQMGSYYVFLAAGPFHTCALTNLGKAHCWGRNNNGALGIALTTTALFTPSENSVNPTSVKFKRIAAGGNHLFVSTASNTNKHQQLTCGITTSTVAAEDNKLYCWGTNAQGQLGNGSTPSPTPVTSPVAVRHDLSFADVSIGDLHTCAITRTQEVYCWGNSALGRLGKEGVSGNQPAPISVTSFSTN